MKIVATLFLFTLLLPAFYCSGQNKTNPCKSIDGANVLINGTEDSLGGKVTLFVLNSYKGIYLAGRYFPPASISKELKLICVRPIHSYYTISFTDGDVYTYYIPDKLEPMSSITILLKGIQLKTWPYLRKKIKKKNINAYGDTILANKLSTKLVKNISIWEKIFYVEQGKITSEAYKSAQSYSIPTTEAERLRLLIKCILSQEP